MKEFLNAYRDIIIAVVVSIVIGSVCNLLKINNTAANYILTSIVPITIPTFIILMNRPKFYLKMMYIKLKHSDVRFKFEIKLENINLDNSDKYNKFIDEFTNNFKSKNSDIKVIKNIIGEYIANTILCIDANNYEFYYNFEDMSLFLNIESNVRYRMFFKVIDETTLYLNNVVSTSRSIGYEKSISVLEVKFLDESDHDFTNPVFKNTYKEFNPKLAKLKYQSDNTDIELTNNSIILKSSDAKYINEAINKELKFFNKKN